MPSLIPVVWLAATLVVLVMTERWINRHLQGVLLLISRDPDIAMIVYAILMLPGVIVHEASHWLMATFLGVRTGRFSVFPQRTEDGHLRLGFVETERTDVFREALIGAAPFLAGALLLGLIGYRLLPLGSVSVAVFAGDLPAALQAVGAVVQAPDAWLWLYFLFVVGNAMLPSRSDQRAWLPATGIVAIILGVIVYAGLGGLLADWLVTPVLESVQALAGALAIALGINLLAAPAIWLAERAAVRLTGMRVEY
jgi:hypothetical protein